MNTSDMGKWGEHQALLYLQRRGYSLVCSNYHSRFGEIDLIVEDDRNIVFAEVKTRSGKKIANACEFVDRRKISKIITTAEEWIAQNGCFKQPRFDVIEVYAENGYGSDSAKINHITNAF